LTARTLESSSAAGRSLLIECDVPFAEIVMIFLLSLLAQQRRRAYGPIVGCGVRPAQRSERRAELLKSTLAVNALTAPTIVAATGTLRRAGDDGIADMTVLPSGDSAALIAVITPGQAHRVSQDPGTKRIVWPGSSSRSSIAHRSIN
jgi:hypothetical protein